MTLLSFSDPKHVSRILSGEKAQTTRKPRKYPIKAGGTLQVYFRSGMKKDCVNCIFGQCPASVQTHTHAFRGQVCAQHQNFFGTAKVIKVEDFDPHLLSQFALEAWAKADGFESFEEADEWFTKVYGQDWTSQPWDIIHFEGDWLK